MLHLHHFADALSVQISAVSVNIWMRNNAQNNKEKQG